MKNQWRINEESIHPSINWSITQSPTKVHSRTTVSSSQTAKSARWWHNKWPRPHPRLLEVVPMLWLDVFLSSCNWKSTSMQWRRDTYDGTMFSSNHDLHQSPDSGRTTRVFATQQRKTVPSKSKPLLWRHCNTSSKKARARQTDGSCCCDETNTGWSELQKGSKNQKWHNKNCTRPEVQQKLLTKLPQRSEVTTHKTFFSNMRLRMRIIDAVLNFAGTILTLLRSFPSDCLLTPKDKIQQESMPGMEQTSELN